MEKVLGAYLDSQITRPQVEEWLQGNVPEGDWAQLFASVTVQNFVAFFADHLHSSFNWLLKQSSNTPATVIKPKVILTDKSLNLEDEEAFPTLEAAKNQSSKRINPTTISSSVTNRESLNGSSFQMKMHHSKSKVKSSERQERELLKRDVLDFKKSLNNAQQSKTTYRPRAVEMLSNDISNAVIEPKYLHVSYREEIEKLKELFLFMLLNNYLSSIVDEIRFVLEVLNKRSVIEFFSPDKTTSHEEKPSPLTKIFSSYHNCFYFVYLVFEEIFLKNCYINFLNITAFNHILECNHLFTFKSDSNLRSLIDTFLSTKLSSVQLQPRDCSDWNLFVLFQPDTDCRSNFPNNVSFSTFRRQRDEFYRIFKTYSENSWDLSISRDRKTQHSFEYSIRAILSLSKDVGNSYHLARLFVDQLQKSCIDIFEDKLAKLENRFIKKHNTVPFEMNNLLDQNFSQKEKFFRDFIYYADSYSFNLQLKLILKSKLLDLTSSESLWMDTMENESKNNFLLHLTNLNLLAKFYGFLCFYSMETSRCEGKSNENDFYSQQKELRVSSQADSLPLDVETYLVNSIQSHSLVVAIPWVVEFLTFVDQISISMDFYDQVFTLLVLIYKFYLPNLGLAPSCVQTRFSFTRIFLQLYLEKLFAIKRINVLTRLKMLLDNSKTHGDITQSLFQKTSSKATRNCEDVYLDFHDELLNSNVISYFFPQFSRLVIDIFQQFSNGYRKITPIQISSNKPQTNNHTEINVAPTSTKLMLQTKAEEYFLNLHSNSLKKCIQFLYDRISANCIKRIKKEYYPSVKAKHFAQVIASNDKKIDTEKCSKIRAECRSCFVPYSEQSIGTLFVALTDDELQKDVVDYAIGICLRNIRQRCNGWIEVNITDEIIQEDLNASYRRQNETQLEPSQTLTAQDIANKFSLFEKSVFWLRDVLNKRTFELAECQQIIRLLEELKDSSVEMIHVSNRKFIEFILLDVAISIIAFNPAMMTNEMLEGLCQYWRSHQATYQRVICPKNVYLLSISNSLSTTWLKFELLLRRLLKLGIYKFSDLDKDVFALMSIDLSDDVRNRFSSLLQGIVDFARQNQIIDIETDGQSHQYLEWLAWMNAARNFPDID